MVRLLASPSLRKTLPEFEWSVVAQEPTLSSCGLKINPDQGLDSIPNAHVIFVCAIGAYTEEDLLAIVSGNTEVQSLLRKAYENGASIVGLCTGTLVLAEAGMLKNREATTSWWLSPKFAARYSDTALNASKMVTVDERIICAGAGAAYFDATLAVLHSIGGPWLSEMVANYFIVDQKRASQTAYMIPSHLAASDPKIRNADRIIRENLSHGLNVASLASQLGVSERSLHRKMVSATGLTPGAYISNVRIELAKTLLLQKDLSVDAVAERVGYADASSFRRAFKAEVGMPIGAFASLHQE